jgi:D-glycero-D-manno-heptose 1,7-bisphosphate phosphatase
VSQGQPGVFLDRDGVLNEVRMDGDVASTPLSVAELRIYPDARPQLERLRDAGFALIVVSNQPDIARGSLARSALEAINRSLRDALPVDAVYVCPHDTRDACDCRKPKPGLILRGAEDIGVDLNLSCLIGDRWVDIAAARAAAIDGILLHRSWSWEPTSLGAPPADLNPDFVGEDLSACVDWVLAAGANS